LKEDSDAYKARIVAQAHGDAQRFKSVLVEYQRAPQVTRDRMYIDTMQQIYSNVSKVMVDSRQGSNLLYLPLDKLMQATGTGVADPGFNANAAAALPTSPPAVDPVADARARDAARSRSRESR